MKFVKALVLLIVIPAFGFGVSMWVLGDSNAALAKSNLQFKTMNKLCSSHLPQSNPSIAGACDRALPILLTQKASIISGVVAILLLLSFYIAAIVAGKSRTKITRIFPPLVFTSLVVLAILVLVQGAILTYSVYLFEAKLFNTTHLIIIVMVGFGALAGGFGLIKSSFKLASKQPLTIIGTKLDRHKQRKLFDFVENIANKLGARAPDNIVVGLEPNFYVTSGDVSLLDDDSKLKGETLFMSLPLSRIITIEELTAIIGHELGHFRGNDTYYSLKFAPVYAGLTHGLESMSTNIATIPAVSVLTYMIEAFHKNISTISREREFAADRAATEVAKPKALATSLLKLSLYAHAWGNLENSVADRLVKGQGTQNMSWLFSSIVKYDVSPEKIPEVIDDIANDSIAHPTDSHPPTIARIEKVGVNTSDIDHRELLLQKHNSIDLIEEYRVLEEKLTELQLQYYFALGIEAANEEDINYGAKLLSAFAAHMVLADGKVLAEEVDDAEAIGLELSDDFDFIEFREYCHYPENLPEVDAILEMSKDLEVETKNLIYEYLEKIANADNEVSFEEKALLDKIKNNFS